MLLIFVEIFYPAVSGTMQKTKMRAKVEKNASIINVHILPPSASKQIRNMDERVKSLN